MAEKNRVKRSRFGIISGVLGAVILLPVIGGTVFFLTFNPDQYRAEISDFLSGKLGRKVSLNGAMRLKLAGGLALEVNDIVLANPAWGSRPEMAKIGQMSLAVKLTPLLQTPRRLDVEKVTLSDADVQLETNAAGAKNWDFPNAHSTQDRKIAGQDAAANPSSNVTKTDASTTEGGKKLPLDISIEQLIIKNVRFAMLDGGKQKTTEVRIKELSLKAQDKTDLDVTGVFNQQPFNVTLAGAAWQDLLANKAWPFTAQAKFMGNDFSGQGTLYPQVKQIDLADFKLATSFGSHVTGAIKLQMAGVRPEVRGALQIDAVQVPEAKPKAEADDAASAAPEGNNAAVAAAPAGRSQLFSDAKFDLSPLKSADVHLDVAIGKIVKGDLVVDNFNTKVNLQNGQLRLPAMTAGVMDNPVSAQLGVNASPPTVDFALNAAEMNMQPILQALGHGNVALGRTTVKLDTHTAGDSPRLLADNLDGTMMLKVGSSVMPAELMGPMLTNMIKLLAPASNAATQNKVTCGTVRFNANNGLLTSNGILLDTALASVLGEGTVDLRSEQLKLTFQPQAKDSKLAALAAPMYMSGALNKPAFKMDSVGTLAGLASTFLGKDLPVAGAKPVLRVPVVNAALADPCTEALDHPVYAAEAAETATPAHQGGAVLNKLLGGDKAPPILKNILGGDKSPLKGLFGQ